MERVAGDVLSVLRPQVVRLALGRIRRPDDLPPGGDRALPDQLQEQSRAGSYHTHKIWEERLLDVLSVEHFRVVFRHLRHLETGYLEATLEDGRDEILKESRRMVIGMRLDNSAGPLHRVVEFLLCVLVSVRYDVMLTAVDDDPVPQIEFAHIQLRERAPLQEHVLPEHIEDLNFLRVNVHVYDVLPIHIRNFVIPSRIKRKFF